MDLSVLKSIIEHRNILGLRCWNPLHGTDCSTISRHTFPYKFQYAIQENYLVPATIIFEDNQGYIFVPKSDIVNDRSKNVDIKYQMMIGHVRKGTVTLEYIPSKRMLADIFTKSLVFEKNSRLCTDMGLKFISVRESVGNHFVEPISVQSDDISFHIKN